MERVYSDELAPRADTYYEVKVTVEKLSRRKATARNLWTAIAGALTPQYGLIPYDVEPKLESDVSVVRRADAAVVANYHYTVGSEARDHLLSLQERLSKLSIPDFDRALGIGFSTRYR